MDKKRDKQPYGGTKRQYLAACTFDDKNVDVDKNEIRETFFLRLIDSEGRQKLSTELMYSVGKLKSTKQHCE